MKVRGKSNSEIAHIRLIGNEMKIVGGSGRRVRIKKKRNRVSTRNASTEEKS